LDSPLGLVEPKLLNLFLGNTIEALEQTLS